MWKRVPSRTKATLEAVWGSSADDLYCGGAEGTLLHSTNRGRTWRPLETKRKATRFESIWGSGPDDVYVCGDRRGTLMHSTDRGRSWQLCKTGFRFNTDDLRDLWGSGPDDVYAVGSASGGGVILHSSDRGLTWQTRLSGAPHGINAIWGASRDDVYAVGFDVLYRSVDGATWSEVPLDRSELTGSYLYLMDLWGDAEGHVIVVSNRARFFSRPSSGVWPCRRYAAQGGISASRIGGASIARLLVLDELGALFESRDAGESWSEVPLPEGTHLRGVWSGGGLTVAVGREGVIFCEDEVAPARARVRRPRRKSVSG